MDRALHPQAARVLEMIAALGGPAIEGSTPAEYRAHYDSRILPSTEEVHEIVDLAAGGVPCRLYRPSAARDLPLCVYYHGGGWVIGGLDSHDAVCRSLANAAGVAVLSVDYRLAPEHPWPAAVADAMCALRWASENAGEIGIDPARIAVAGDSAGGNLAAVVAQQRPVPVAFQLLVYPATDLTMSRPSHAENAAGPVLTAGAMSWFVGHYLVDAAQATDELVSPLLAPDSLVAGVPPALVITAQFDPLRDEGEEYGARINALGGSATVVRFNGHFHGFFSQFRLIDDAARAHTLAAEALRRALA